MTGFLPSEFSHPVRRIAPTWVVIMLTLSSHDDDPRPRLRHPGLIMMVVLGHDLEISRSFPTPYASAYSA